MNLEISAQDLYNLLFDVGRSDREHIEVSENLLAQISLEQELARKVHYDNELRVLWRKDAWIKSNTFYLLGKRESEEERHQRVLQKQVARRLESKLNMDYEQALQLVYTMCRKKNPLLFRAVGIEIEDEKWKGLIL